MKKQIIIDESQFESITEIHKFLAEQLQFPKYYGHNLDALWDMLTSEVEHPLAVKWIVWSDNKDFVYAEQLKLLYQLFVDLTEEIEGFEFAVVELE